MKYKTGDKVKIHSGLGGTFNVLLLFYDKKGNKWQCKITMPLNPDWDNYIIWTNRNNIINLIH